MLYRYSLAHRSNSLLLATLCCGAWAVAQTPQRTVTGTEQATSAEQVGRDLKPDTVSALPVAPTAAGGSDTATVKALRKDLQETRDALANRLDELDSLLRSGSQQRVIGYFQQAQQAPLFKDDPTALNTNAARSKNAERMRGDAERESKAAKKEEQAAEAEERRALDLLTVASDTARAHIQAELDAARAHKQAARSRSDAAEESLEDARAQLIALEQGTADTANATITSAALFVRDAQVEAYKVVLANGDIYEGHRPVSMYMLDREGGKAKLRCSLRPGSYLRLSDVIAYHAEVDQRYVVPGDGKFQTDHEHDTVRVDIDAGLSWLVDYRLYTDMLALLGEESNGLVQTEASAKFYYNIFSLAPGCSMFEWIQAQFHYSKFDSEFSTLKLDDPYRPYLVPMVALNQHTFLDLGLRANVFKVNINLATFAINGGINYGFTRVMDMDSVTSTLNTFSFFLEERLQFLRTRNFGINIGFGILWQHIYDPEFDYIPDVARQDVFLRTDFEVFYHPTDKPDNRIFLRFKHLQDGWENSYPQLQLGYSATLKVK